jgi:hypothetical protein
MMTDEQQIQKQLRENNEHNTRMMDEHNIPQPARRGFRKATGHGFDIIKGIVRHETDLTPYGGKVKHCWIVTVGSPDYDFMNKVWTVGPRGGAR